MAQRTEIGASSWRLGDVDGLHIVRMTRVVLAAAHRDHTAANDADANLSAFCQRCHMIHDRPEHQRRSWIMLSPREDSGDVFGWPYVWGVKAGSLVVDDSLPCGRRRHLSLRLCAN
jgi:hypothetical protein